MGFDTRPLSLEWLYDPPNLLFNGYRGPFPGVKTWQRHDADHSPPNNAEIKNKLEQIIVFPQASLWRVADSFTLLSSPVIRWFNCFATRYGKRLCVSEVKFMFYLAMTKESCITDCQLKATDIIDSFHVCDTHNSMEMFVVKRDMLSTFLVETDIRFLCILTCRISQLSTGRPNLATCTCFH